MSGHSKWSTIKHRKGAQDAKRSKIFSRIAKMIIVSAQQGGGDPEMNSGLKMLLDQARKANMPKDNIERAIKAGTGEGSEGRLEEVTYEAMGPEGVSMIISCATDNTNRSLTDVKTALKKNGGKFVPGGSVSFNYAHVGVLTFRTSDVETAELDAIDAGAEDVTVKDDLITVFTSITEFHNIQKALTEKNYTLENAELTYRPEQTVTLSDTGISAYEKLYDAVDDVDDVQTIHDNIA